MGVLLGFFVATLVAVIGWWFGPVVARAVSQVSQIGFRQRGLTTLWGVHATISSLSLVGLSFAWNSVRDLSTRRIIIDEAAYRIRSIETIVFLLTSNLLIGAGALFTTSEFVTASVGGSVGGLLVVSVAVAVRRFWTVFDLLLHNTLDEKTIEFAKNTLIRRPDIAEDEYPEYLGHFFDDCHEAIDQNRSSRLRTQLQHVEDLLEVYLDGSKRFENNTRFLRFVFDTYDSLYRRCVDNRGPVLSREVACSLYGIYLVSLKKRSDEEIALSCLDQFCVLFVRGCAEESTEFPSDTLLDRIESIQQQAFWDIIDAETSSEIAHASKYADKVISTEAQMWKAAVEHEAIKEIDYLRGSINEICQSSKRKYSNLPNSRDGCQGLSVPIEEQKKSAIDSPRKSVLQLQVATYAWTLKIYKEGDISDRFISHVFSVCIREDLGGVGKLTESYLSIQKKSDPINYWEQWNLNREAENSHGVVTTGMAINTWLFEFYCTALVWSVNTQSKIDDIKNRDPKDSPAMEYEDPRRTISNAVDRIEDYQNEYPLADLVGDGPSVASRTKALTSYLSRLVSEIEKKNKNRIRSSPIHEPSVSKFSDDINSTLESNRLRTALDEASEIRTVGEAEASGELEICVSGALSYPRELFADETTELSFNNSYNKYMDKISEGILEGLNISEREFDCLHSLTEQLTEIISGREAAVIIGDMDTTRDLRDDDRSEFHSSDIEGSYFSFLDVPVVEETTDGFAAVVLFPEKIEYIEERDDGPISVDVTPGENVGHWDEDDLSDDQDVRDHVLTEVSYEADIKTDGVAGIVFRYAD